MNLYLVLAVLISKKLRKLQYYPVFLMALGDLVCSGFAALFHFLVENSNQENDDYYWLNQFFYYFRHSTVKIFWLTCVPLVLYHRINEYVTGICTLILATERFIVYCAPNKVSVLLTPRMRLITYLSSTVFIIAITIFEIVFRYKTFNHWQFLNCSYGFVPGFNASFYSMIVTGIIFFAIPALVSIFMYIRIFMVLFNAEGRKLRNRIVTIALGTSCLIWVALWSLKYAFQTAHFLFSWHFWEVHLENPKLAMTVSQDTAQFFPIFSSVTNPFVLLIVCSVFRKPIMDLVCCCRKKKDDNNEMSESLED
ncbi:uncharacterized protein LOC142344164 [Convolutriloba macropyga]|uniref:uncharacterized protein LOC142344164 n=1 Tax=Convolutriloba macropyga TaxID=536237 RepID=UPI003F51E2A9